MLVKTCRAGYPVGESLDGPSETRRSSPIAHQPSKVRRKAGSVPRRATMPSCAAAGLPAGTSAGGAGGLSGIGLNASASHPGPGQRNRAGRPHQRRRRFVRLGAPMGRSVLRSAGAARSATSIPEMMGGNDRNSQ